jgi:hypothetical protein
MGILRSEPPDACADDPAALALTVEPAETFVPLATLGIEAASSPVPVAARNSRRSMLDALRGFFMPSP